MKNILIGGVIVVIAIGGWFIIRQNKQNVVSDDIDSVRKILVVTTFYPLADFARNVGGDYVDVVSIVPAGAEPHDYEPTPQDIMKAYTADVFLINGAGFDAWAEKIKPELVSRGVSVMQMSDLVTLLPGTHEEHDEEESAHEEEMHEEHEEGQFDPHFWLDPILVQQQVESITRVLGERDPAHKVEYETQGNEFRVKLQTLDALYRSSLTDCRLDTVVTSHNAFAYLAKRYGFATLSVSGLSPEAEASPRHLAEIATAVKAKRINHIFFETLVSPKVAQTLAQEVGAETLVFNPIEGLTDEERLAGVDYLAIMNTNLHNLTIALQCQK